ncbi:hypothetical protein HPB52_019764 [Rhipicephalus sanguineus]|uniref:D-isomer specific 2-hydroxyacid dehydrogenase NAD-binding domain-containing protein n=1 Tax=Rhipicephalus sanguineus TaxID=34632 RepID=A0A9D4Q266_RHISA|nr:hypothetical protein HPB52_019764 [Rhipicephalus sanguineus]
MALAIKKVLISDAVDASCVKILENHGVQVTLKTDHTKPELLEAIKTIGFDPIVPKEVSREFGVESLSLDEIWPQADYITVHTPLIPQTKDLIGKASLQKCKKGVKIVNVARGGIVNEDDLLAALESGHCSGAGLDVFVEEPPKNTKLIEHPKVVCTPHLGANTKEAQLRVAQEIAEQFVALSKGQSVNAPSLSQTQVPENKPWADLCIALGKIAAGLVGSLASGLQVELTTKGTGLEKKGQFLSSAACIGLLNQFGQSHANFINVTVLSSDSGVKASHKHVPQAAFGEAEVALSVKSGSVGHTVVGTVSGPSLLLCSLDNATFQPVQLLSPGGMLVAIGENSPNTFAEVIGSLVKNGVSVLSASCTTGHEGKAFYLFRTGSPVKAQTQPPIAPLKFWTYISI